MAKTDRDVQYRQIITKAICGRGRKFSQATHAIRPPDNISNILGAWIINHSYEAHRVGEVVEVMGNYDINIWYATKGNTKTDVAKETVRYVDQVPLNFYDRNLREDTISVNAVATQSPNCIEATIASSEDSVLVRVEREFLVEVTGETKICVACYPHDYEDLEDKEYGPSSLEADVQDFDDLDPDLVIDDLD
ncbi:spore coat protein E [Polycladomyces abyssicola]|uniref:Spore coat protein E n=1 Tax=Polycladomyces abyssicola TaxID=1125966 RepID=A0A8D5ZP51_9BACL|nr:outer spore coat protein CotE [Polycladomyces abyssicola]BCU81993.1 spore coat protein E [Polycladomyces abyssicola]